MALFSGNLHYRDKVLNRYPDLKYRYQVSIAFKVSMPKLLGIETKVSILPKYRYFACIPTWDVVGSGKCGRGLCIP